MARVLKTGGKLVVIDMEAAEEALRNTENEIETLRDPSHVRKLSKEEFTRNVPKELFVHYDIGVHGTSCFVIRLAKSHKYTCGDMRRHIQTAYR